MKVRYVNVKREWEILKENQAEILELKVKPKIKKKKIAVIGFKCR